jgi:hypothetical protein
MLVWHKWEDTDTVPLDELLLFKCGTRGDFQTGTFTLTSNGGVFGTVGDAFYFDRTLIEYASIQHLVDNK